MPTASISGRWIGATRPRYEMRLGWRSLQRMQRRCLLMITLSVCISTSAAANDLDDKDHGSNVGNTNATQFQVLHLHRFTEPQYNKMWRRAIDALGSTGKMGSSSPSTHPFCQNKGKSCTTHFYNMCFHTSHSEKLNAAYLNIPKGANNAIKCNLGMSSEFSRKPSEDPRRKKAAKGSGVSFQRTCGGTINSPSFGTRVFTFVREPIAHFFSGYKEVEFRNPGAYWQKLFKHNKGSKERVEEFVYKLLHEQFPSGMPGNKPELYHTYVQSGHSLLISKIGVGKLEYLDQHWKQMQTWLGVVDPTSFQNVCNHEETTHGDPQGTVAAAREALAGSIELHRSLCFLLLPDYISYGYPLPPECEYDAMHELLEELGNPTIQVSEGHSEKRTFLQPKRSKGVEKKADRHYHLHHIRNHGVQLTGNRIRNNG